MARQLGWFTVFGFAGLVGLACSAGSTGSGGSGPGGGGTGGSGATSTTGGGPQGAGPQGGGGDGGSGASTFVQVGGSGGQGTGGEGATIINPCGTGCVNLGGEDDCDGVLKGLDDNCNGEVDEGCPCTGGQASSCFRGDSSFLNDQNPNCAAGTMQCTENGTWGPCNGGKHAWIDAQNPEACNETDQLGCHPINGVPFATIDLSEGPGNFNNEPPAITSEMYEVACPAGVTPCPAVTGNTFTPLQSGEYTVTYTKVTANGTESCDFPLFVGARGLRVELSWNYPSDLDLHLKQPDSTLPWNFTFAPPAHDCGYGNCTASDLLSGGSLGWFPAGNMVPDPVNRYEHPTLEENNCYFAPRGVGDDWEAASMGCPNPRLDLDNVTCTLSQTDPQNSSFCAPENINIDYPPKDQWMRIGVHYFSGSQATITPTVKIFCDGALAAELGAQGYYTPEAPLTLGQSDVRKLWIAADVLFHEDECVKQCIVEPLHLVGTKNPVILTEAQATGASGNGPPYPQNPFTQQ